jgi:hypothetical protein
MGLHGWANGFPFDVNFRWDGTTQSKIAPLETIALEKNRFRGLDRS